MRGQGILYKDLPKFNDNSYAHSITTRTYENRPYFKNDEFSRILLGELRFYSQKYGLSLIGYVIMPDHVHMLLWWEKDEKPDLTVSKIVQVIKGTTARRCVDLSKSRGWEHLLQATQKDAAVSKSHKRNLKYRLWQAGFYDFNVHSEEKLLEKLNYVHNNPVKAGLVSSPCDYKWSSYKKYFKEKNG
jgi:REP element-mobilizing transposase RayT